jgi:O-antigen/teichoic acid export membrane protein
MRAWHRFRRNDPLMSSAYSLVANGALTAGLGVAFWVVAARLYDPVEVGRDAALIAVMLELSTICQLNMVNAITRILPSLRERTASALVSAYAASAGAALVGGLVFVFVAPRLSNEFGFLSDDWRLAALYVIALVAWGWFALQDAALTAVRRAGWVPVENGSFGLLKLAALPAFLALGVADGVFLAWTLPVLLLLLPVNLFLFRTAIPQHLRNHRPGGSAVLARLGRRGLARFMAQDYGATVLALAPTAVLPLLIVALLGADANAYFFIPYTMVGAVNMLFFAAGTSLVVEGALAEDRLRAMAGRMARRFALTVVPGTAVMIAAAPVILLPFGEDYVRESSSVLRLLACGCVFYAALALYVAIARVQGRSSGILAVEVLKLPLMLGGAVALSGPFGIDGVALAWLGSVAMVALAVTPSLLRFFRGGAAPEPALRRLRSVPERVHVP